MINTDCYMFRPLSAIFRESRDPLNIYICVYVRTYVCIYIIVCMYIYVCMCTQCVY